VAVERIEPGARVYAEALYEAAGEAGRVTEVDRDLTAFVNGIAQNRLMLGALANPRLPRHAKQGIVVKLMEGAEPLARNAVLVLLDKGRLAFLHDVQVAYSEMAAAKELILDVEVTTAVPLQKKQVSSLEERIGEAIGGRARVTAQVDDEIIGGLVLRARGVLLDASVRRRLEELRRALVNTPLAVGGTT
jgi:F-type H+-transporting ATPase subunit delta